MKRIFIFFVLLLTCLSASAKTHTVISKPYYIGLSGGYGSTLWGMITTSPQSDAALSSPIAAKDNGFVWGLLLGYYVASYFALELDYMHFTQSTVIFNPVNFYNNLPQMTSSTAAYAIFGKFIIPIKFIPHLSAFANAGLALIHRKDVLANKAHFGGIFGVGLILSISSRWLAQLAFQFYTGYGKAELLPAKDYIPFLCQGQLVIAYRFG